LLPRRGGGIAFNLIGKQGVELGNKSDQVGLFNKHVNSVSTFKIA